MIVRLQVWTPKHGDHLLPTGRLGHTGDKPFARKGFWTRVTDDQVTTYVTADWPHFMDNGICDLSIYILVDLGSMWAHTYIYIYTSPNSHVWDIIYSNFLYVRIILLPVTVTVDDDG